jgi:nucleoid-associated protein YgaU
VDGVERIMVLGIFAVIVAILGVAAWSVTQDGGADPVGAADGGALTGTALKIEEPGDRKSAMEAQSRLADVILGRTPRAEAKAGKGPKNGKNQLKGADLAANGGSAKTLPRPPGPGGTQQPKGAQPAGPQGKADPQAAHKANRKPGGALVDPAVAQGGKPQGAQKPKPQPAEPKPKAPTFREYTVVVKGDGLWAIARRELGPDNVKQSVEAIQKLNPGIGDLAIGQVIKLPVAKAKTPVADTKAPAGYRHYVVQSGDNLSTICERELGTSTRVDELFELNKDQLATKHDLKVGQRLLIPNT